MVEKEEFCKTIDKLLNDYPDGKFSQKAKMIVDYECFENEE